MICLPLKADLVSVGAAATELTLTPPDSQWLDLSPFQDIVAFLEVIELNANGGILSLLYQSAPTKDEAWFTTAATVTPLTTGLTVTPMIAKLINNPLSRWLRWQLAIAGPLGTWDATFRIWIAASAVRSASARKNENVPSIAGAGGTP